jgi:PKD repeat protein
MKKILLMTGFAALILGACRKSAGTGAPPPIASFSFDGDTSSSLAMPAFGGYSLINNSSNIDSCVWDFGNDSVYHTNEAWLTYSKPGNYTLTLTVYGDGRKSVSNRQIHVYGMVLKQVVISLLDLNANGIYQTYFGYPSFNKVNVWVGVQQALFNHQYSVLPDGTFNAPFIYKSPVQTGIDSTNVPISFQVPGKLAFDSAAHGIGGEYGFNIYSQNNSGTFTLGSTYWAQNGYSSSCNNCLTADNRFNPNGSYVLRTGFEAMVDMSFISDFEQ